MSNDLDPAQSVAIGGTRHPADTPELRAAVIAGILERFALNPAPRRGIDVYLEVCERHGLAPDRRWIAIASAMSILVGAGLLTCNTIDQATGIVLHTDETVIAGSDVLTSYMATTTLPITSH